VSDLVDGTSAEGEAPTEAAPTGAARTEATEQPDASEESEEPTPVRRAIDLLVFAPVGVALTVVEDLPALINKGRQRFETDVRNARVIGQFVVNHGQRDLTQRVTKLFHGGGNDVTGAGTIDAVATDVQTTVSTPSSSTTPSPPPEAPTSSVKPAPDPADAVAVEAALAGYDTLSASQVVRRLESLGPDELRAVFRHEASHRNRRTILNRAQQLLEGPVG
jgi:hypothetical protein